MKILFIYKGRYHIRDTVIIEYLSSIAKDYGYSTGLVYDQDLFGITDNVIYLPLLNKIFSNFNRLIRKIIKDISAHIVVFLDGFNRRAWNKEIAEKIKEIGEGVITVCLYYWRPPEERVYDYVLVGEPELTFREFLEGRLFNKAKGEYEFSGLVDLNGLPLLDKELFAPYVNFKDSYPIYTSKGCPYSCSYCEETVYKNKLGKEYFRRKYPENVILELEEAKRRFNIREIIYKDSVFTWDKIWLKSYLEEYKKKIDLPYKCFGKAEVFDEEIAQMLKESGCYCVEFGVQTLNEELKYNILKREEKTSVLLKAFSICDKYKLRYDIDHMFGIPGEKVEDHIKAAKLYINLRYLNRIKCHNLTFYKEAPIYQYAPSWIKSNEEYKADFFSTISGDKFMVEINRVFEKYYKVLPLLPKRFNFYILERNKWKLFKFLPNIFIFFLMFLLALKNKDRRFKVYLKYYPKKITQVLLGK